MGHKVTWIGLNSIALSQRLVAGSFEHGDEHPVSLKAMKCSFTNRETTKFSEQTLRVHHHILFIHTRLSYEYGVIKPFLSERKEMCSNAVYLNAVG